MPTFSLPAEAIPAELLQRVRLQIVTASAEPPSGLGGCTRSSIRAPAADRRRRGELKLISRNGHDRTPLFHLLLDKLAAAGLPPLVLDGDRGAGRPRPDIADLDADGATWLIAGRRGGV